MSPRTGQKPSAGTRRRRNLLFVHVALSFAGSPLAAQGVSSHTGSQPGDAASPSATNVVVHATPKQFTIARVPVPAAIPADEPLSYTVHVLGGASVISKLRGSLPASTDARSVLLTFGVPARAAAGRVMVAEVAFESASGRHAAVAVQVEVDAVHSLAVDLVQQAMGTKAGARFIMRYRLTNQGNTADSVTPHFELPYDWKVDAQDTATVVVPSGSSIVRQATVRVPNSAAAGSFGIVVNAVDAAGSARASDRMYVEVPPSRSAPGSRAVSLNTSFARTSGAGGGGGALMGLAFSGAIFRDIQLSVDATSAPALSDQGRYHLSSLGQFPQPPNIMLSRGPARLRIGGVGASFSELTGQGAGGRGTSFGWESPTLSIRTAFAGHGLGFGSATPTTLDTDSPQVAGVRVSSRVADNLWVTGTVAHLDEGKAVMSRKLDVVGAGVTVPSLFGGTYEGEVAYRKFADGTGLGMFSEFTRTSARERANFRVIVAPGGTAAYAGSRAALSGYLSHQLSKKWQLGGQGWLTENSGTAGESARSVGLGVMPQYFLRDGLSLGLDVAGSRQSIESHGASFGNDEQHVSTTLNYALSKQTALSVTGTGARVTRGLAFDSTMTGESQLTSGRASILAQVARGTEHFGTLLLSAQASRDESNSVGLPRQHQLSLRLDRFPVYFPGGSYLYATGIVQNLGWFGDRPSVTTMRGDLTAELPMNLSVTFAVDRNPLVSVAGAGPWSTSLRVARTTYLTMPSFLRFGSRSGVVFEDLNGNGAQDPGEAGMGGVIVRRGDQVVTTDDDGSFKFTNAEGKHTERLKVDPRTLPAGWMESGTPISEEEAKKVKAIGIVPTAGVRLHFIIRREDLGVTGPIDLTRIVVVARDSMMRTYLAQPTDSMTQAFSALPPGSYAMSVDPSAAGAALQVSQAPTNFRVGAERSGHDYEIVLATRTVKMKTFGRPAEKAPAAATPAEAKPAPVTLPNAALPRRSTGAVADTVIMSPRTTPERKPQ